MGQNMLMQIRFNHTNFTRTFTKYNSAVVHRHNDHSSGTADSQMSIWASCVPSSTSLWYRDGLTALMRFTALGATDI